MNSFNKLLLICVVTFVFAFGFVVADPSGATTTPGTSEGADADLAGSVTTAYAGNVTEVNLTGFTNTQAWTGYYGNVSGAIRLADGSDNVMYNWTLNAPGGEVYASNASSITWSSIDCIAASALSFTAIESSWNIDSGDPDGVDETFNLQSHPEFFTAGVQHTASECNNTLLYNNVGTGTFHEVILSDDTSVVFAAILQDDTTGFNGGSYDFEMLVLEDGHGGDTNTDTYYFWVELE